MDHNLEDSLNLETAMGMDFDSAEDVVVSQTNINLDPSHQERDMAMEFEHIEEQPILMDSGNEEIIVSDFMGDQFNLQEYSIHDDQTSGMTTTEDSNQQNMLANQSETIDLQFEPQDITPVRLEVKGKSKYIAVKAASSAAAPKKPDTSMLTGVPRQIAIAPKLPKLVPAVAGRFTLPQTKQIAIAPTPVALVTNRTNVVKKLPVATVVKDSSQGATVLAQIAKQLVMVPKSASGQKIKLVTTSNTGMSTVQYIKAGSDQAQLIPTKSISGLQTNKPVMAKVIVQGQSNVDLNQSAVITKLMPATSVTSAAATPQPHTRYVMQRKTVPISLTKEVVMGSPTKQGVKFMKKHQIISFKSPTTTPKLMPAQTTGTATKVMIAPNPTNPSQNVILKTTAPPKTAQITKDGKVVLQGQRSQLHQINVPGKGIQYIRLISNQTSAPAKTVSKPQALGATKSFVISDNKGNLIQVSAAKVAGSQPPPLVFTSNSTTDKRTQKLVRIAAAPLTMKATSVTQASSRSSQSLLAPLASTEAPPEVVEETSPEPPTSNSLEALDPDTSQELQLEALEEYEVAEAEAETEVEEHDSKAALHALIADAVADDARTHELTTQSPEESESSNTMEHLVHMDRPEEHPLIVISSNYMKQEPTNEHNRHQDDLTERSMHIEKDILNSYQPPLTPPTISDGVDVITEELGFKPRRACNCTKSQCLKLYCDCFANGEFCNSCNCNNCHNNLDNEELRQKAIRACLERNPNAFRPKIGKTKAGGPEIIRRHNKGCNCKRSGCLKNYCECYEAKITCTSMCKCVGCRNVEDGMQRRPPAPAIYRPPPPAHLKQPCSFMTTEVIEAVCQCLIAASIDNSERSEVEVDPVRDVIEEFSRCLQDVISASHNEGHA